MIKVIWVALPDLNAEKRRKILEELGYTPYNMLEMISDKQKYIDWHTYMLSGKEYQYNWSDLFKDADALTLMYSDVRIEELIEKNPDCKVIFEQLKYEEYQLQLEAYLSFMKLLKRFRFAVRRASRAYISGMKALEYVSPSGDFSQETIQRKIEQLEERIPRRLSKDRLLVLKTADYNWKELCHFLDSPIPEKPIPYSSSRNSHFSTFIEVLIDKFKRLWIWYFFYLIVIISILIYLMML